jgi:hypothetical protein
VASNSNFLLVIKNFSNDFLNHFNNFIENAWNVLENIKNEDDEELKKNIYYEEMKILFEFHLLFNIKYFFEYNLESNKNNKEFDIASVSNILNDELFIFIFSRIGKINYI